MRIHSPGGVVVSSVPATSPPIPRKKCKNSKLADTVLASWPENPSGQEQVGVCPTAAHLALGPQAPRMSQGL